MGKYGCIFGKAFKMQAVYRVSMYLGILKSLIAFFIQVSLWYALVGAGANNSVSFSDMTVYLVLNTAILTLTQANVAADIEASVIDGSVSMHIIRPVSFKFYTLATVLGQNAFRFLTGAVPVLLPGIFLAWNGFTFPSPVYLALFLASTLIGMLIMFELTYAVGLLAFWIQRCWFLKWYLDAGMAFFGGTVVPLWFYPQGLQAVSRFLPFRYILFEPVNLFLHKVSVQEGAVSLAAGGIWLVLLVWLERSVWLLALDKMTVNGG